MAHIPRLALPEVTIVAISSVNLAATVAALEASIAQVKFGEAKLLSDYRPNGLPGEIEWVEIAPLISSWAYSDFVLHQLADYVRTPHCLLIQWDGHVINSARWRPEFLDYDYIGASWPQFTDGRDVGNGGFSLRSRALMEACRDPAFRPSHPEDVAIGRHNRTLLEARGLRFAPRDLADTFSTERAGDLSNCFGYHGVWHMPRVLGPEKFWQIYRGLDERTSVQSDFVRLLWQLSCRRGGAVRSPRLIADRFRDAVKSRRTC
jgi:hypothetical protein